MSFANILGLFGLGGQVAGAIGSTYASYRASKATQKGYEYQAQVARNNEQLAEWQAQDAIERGVTKEANLRLQTGQLYGRQESILASRNVAINEGSALNILVDTKFMGERDAATVRNNAAKEAWALRNQARGFGSDSEFLRYRAESQSPFGDAMGTLLTAGGKVAESWYRRSSPRRGDSDPYAWGG